MLGFGLRLGSGRRALKGTPGGAHDQACDQVLRLSPSGSRRKSQAHFFNGRVQNMTFFDWLSRQAGRQDATGVLARFAVKDPLFPRQVQKLGIILRRYEAMPYYRDAAKSAHREWRRVRLGRVAA